MNKKKVKYEENKFKRKKNYNFNKVIEEIIWKLFPTGTNMKSQKNEMQMNFIMSNKWRRNLQVAN